MDASRGQSMAPEPPHRAGTLSHQEQSNIIRQIWDLDLELPRDSWVLSDLQAYFATNEATKRAFRPHGRHTHGDGGSRAILYCVKVLRNLPKTPRQRLESYLREAIKNYPVSGTNAVQVTPRPFTQQESEQYDLPAMSKDEATSFKCIRIDVALTNAVTLMYSIRLLPEPCRTDSDNRIPHVPVYLSMWTKEKSLQQLIEAFLPQFTDTGEPGTPLRPSQLAVAYLSKYASIEIKWTDHLPNHLHLIVDETSKTLFVFSLPSFLRVTYEAFREQKVQNVDRNDTGDMSDDYFKVTMDTSLQRGRYPPAFLYETLMTYRLLFPISSRRHTEQILRLRRRHAWPFINSVLPGHNRTGSAEGVLDGNLAVPYEDWHRPFLYERPLTNRRELFDRFPHWAVRLHILYEEADDPTPMTWFEKWSERRKTPRHSFKVTFLAFVLAIVFGMSATLLAAWQLAVALHDSSGKSGKD